MKKNRDKKNIIKVREVKTVKDVITLFLKGCVLGITSIVPGLSAGTFALVLNIYEELIGAASHLLSNFKNNMKYLIPVFVGAGFAVLIGSKVISFCIEHYNLATMLFFVGVILGGLPLLRSHIKGHYKEPINWVLFSCGFVIVLLLYFFQNNGNQVDFNNMNLIKYICLMLVGGIASSAMVIPGVSGSLILQLFGYFTPIINVVKSITDFSILGFNLSICIPFGIGVIAGIILIAKFIEYALKKYEVQTFSTIIGFVLGSVFTIIFGLCDSTSGLISIGELIVGNLLLIFGYFLTFKVTRKLIK